MQQQKAAALGNGRHTARNRRANIRQHRAVVAQLLCVQLRIAAAQIQSVQIVRQMRIVQRRERHELCAHARQHIEAVRVVKAKCLVTRHTDAQPRPANWHRRQLLLQLRCRAGKGEQRIQL